MATINAKALVQAGMSKSMAHHVLAGSRKPSIPFALWLLETCGIALDPIAGKSPSEIALLKKLYPPSAPETVLRRRQASGNGVAA